MPAIKPAIREEFNPSRDEVMSVINTDLTQAQRDVNAMVKHLHQLFEEGALERPDLIAILATHTKVASFESVQDTYLKSPKGGNYDPVVGALLAGESISGGASYPSFTFLVRNAAIRIVNGDIPHSALPQLEASEEYTATLGL